MGNIYIVKKDGTLELFNPEKIRRAVTKSASRVLIDFTEDDLNRKKKVLISNELFSFENIEVINDMIVDNIIFDGKIEKDMIGLLQSLNIQEMNKVINNLSLKNYSIVILKK